MVPGHNRNLVGGSIIELPVLLILVFLVIGLPLIGLATMSYRNALFSWSVKNACTDATKATSYSAAQAAAKSALTRACAAFNGMRLQKCDTTIVTKDLATGSSFESTTVLNASIIDPNRNLYFIRIDAAAQLDPLLPAVGGILGCMPIPGFTCPYPMTTSCELMFERPKGLSS